MSRLAQEALDRAHALTEAAATAGGRCLLGLAGPPGVGKSRLAGDLVAECRATGRAAVVIGLDGFHLGNEVLAERGLSDVKGAPETFDAAGFVALLRRLRTPGRPVWAPGFDRSAEQTVPDAIRVPAYAQLVVVEGNYLLCDGPWRPVRDLLDETWYLDQPDDLRVPRLVARHVEHGRTRHQAQEWVRRTDEANARLVARTRPRADAVLDVSSGRFHAA